MSDAKEVTYFKGKLKSSFSVTEKDDNGNVKKVNNVVSLFREDLTMDDSEKVTEFFEGFYKNTAKKWIPDWHKEGKDYISLKSSYNIPVKIEDENKQMSFSEWVDRGEIRGAYVTLKCNIKDNALYPSALLVHEVGEPYDAFADF